MKRVLAIWCILFGAMMTAHAETVPAPSSQTSPSTINNMAPTVTDNPEALIKGAEDTDDGDEDDSDADPGNDPDPEADINTNDTGTAPTQQL